MTWFISTAISALNSDTPQARGRVVEGAEAVEQEELLEYQPDVAGSQDRERAVVHGGDLGAGDRTEPVLGRSRVATMWSGVDLPEPDGPVTATSSPAPMRKLTPRRTSTGGDPG